MVRDPGEAVLNRTWRPFLAVIGADGLPPIKDAGNVLRPQTALKLSLRIPPLVDGEKAAGELKRILEADPPEGANVVFTPDQGASGWSAPPTGAWLQAAVNNASRAHYGRPAAMMGEGGTIPFMAMLGKHFPQAQFLITGVLGPKSNAHGPERVPTRSLREEINLLRGRGARSARAALSRAHRGTSPPAASVFF